MARPLEQIAHPDAEDADDIDALIGEEVEDPFPDEWPDVVKDVKPPKDDAEVDEGSDL